MVVDKQTYKAAMNAGDKVWYKGSVFSRQRFFRKKGVVINCSFDIILFYAFLNLSTSLLTV